MHLPDAPRPARRRTPWSHAAAAGSVALGGLQLDLLVRGTRPAAYVVLVLALGAPACLAVGVGLAVRNGPVSRAAAVALALAALAAAVLVVTVGLPGDAGRPLDATGGLGAALGIGVPALVAADAGQRTIRNPAGRLPGWWRWSR